jgi:hypothetical protein
MIPIILELDQAAVQAIELELRLLLREFVGQGFGDRCWSGCFAEQGATASMRD